MGKKIRHDWLVIKAEYVEGIVDEKGNRYLPSLEELAVKYGVHAVSVRKHAGAEGWLQRRNAFATKVEEARSAKKSASLAGEAANFDIDSLKLARGLYLICSQDIKRAAEGKMPLSPAEKAALSQAIKNAQQIGRLALGDSTEKVDGAGTMVGNKIEVVFVNSPNGTD